MNAESRIRELARAHITENRMFDGVGFIDQLLLVASEVGEIKCTLAGQRELRFQLSDQPPWEVELDRAKSKLRMLCARLAKLCQDSGGEFIVYGGEAIIRKESLDPLSIASRPGADRQACTGREPELAPVATGVAAAPQQRQQWKVRLKNTMQEQEFIILKQTE